MKKKNFGVIVLIVLLIIALLGNGIQLMLGKFQVINQKNANSRDTYFTIHNIKQAQNISKGEGVRVGILDSYFAVESNPGLYAGGKDFANDPDSLNKDQSHGWMMAAVLREIAPDCEIYALNISGKNENKRVDSMVEAINWAKDNDIDILTFSQKQISTENRDRLDEAVNKAVENGIVTTFIHYDNPLNILPYSTTPYFDGEYNRTPDINVFHYDYNTIIPAQIRAFEKSNLPPESGNDMPYFSYSSMSPVAAGFVAILKGIDNSLTPAQYKQLLIDTSYAFEYDGVMQWEKGVSENTVDIYKAALTLSEGKPSK